MTTAKRFLSTHPGFFYAVVTAALWLAPATARADVVRLADGSMLYGVVQTAPASAPNVTIQTSGGGFALPKRKVAAVEQESDAMDRTRLGDGYLKAGKYSESASEYEMALKADPSLAAAKEGLQKAQTELARINAAKQGAASTDIGTALDNVQKLVAEKKFEEAYSVVRTINIASAPDLKPRYDKLMAEGAYKWALDCIDRQNPGRAAELLQVAVRLDPANDEARRKLVSLWEKDPTQLDRAVTEYAKSEQPEDQLKLADALMRQHKYEEALDKYIRYGSDPKLMTPDRTDRMRQAFQFVHSEYARRAEYDKAVVVYKAFLDRFPSEDLVPLARYEAKLKATQTDMTNPDAVAELAAYVEERGFADQSRKLYAKVLELKPDNALALGAMQRFAAQDLQDVAVFMSDGQYALAAGKAAEIEQLYTMLPGVTQQAGVIKQQAAKMQAQAVQNAKQQGTLYAQRGDDYYSQALSYMSAYMSTNVDQRVRVINPKDEAVKYLRLAIYAWQGALQLDPSLNDPISYDLGRKIAEANGRLAQMTSTDNYIGTSRMHK